MCGVDQFQSLTPCKSTAWTCFASESYRGVTVVTIIIINVGANEPLQIGTFNRCETTEPKQFMYSHWSMKVDLVQFLLKYYFCISVCV